MRPQLPSKAKPAERPPFVRAEKRGQVAIVVIDRPDALNALSEAIVDELLAELASLDKDDGVRAIVITGGPRVFVAGADIKEMADATAAQMRKGDFLAAWDGFAAISKPLIAAVNGFALGGGNELAMNCDLIVAAEDASFGQPEILLGVMPGAGGTQRLARLIGPKRALQYLWTGDRLSARQALEYGLVNAVVPGPLVLEEAVRLAEKIAQQAPIAVRQIKESVYAGLDKTLLDGIVQERKRFYALFDTKDQKEGMRAFIEKRKPAFQGR